MSDKKPENPHAFPLRATAYAAHPGMTLRDYFAAHTPETVLACAGTDLHRAAALSFEWADALLQARESNP